MKTRTLGWVGVVLGLAAVWVWANESTRVSPAIAWSDADARVAQGDAPLYLQLFVRADGHLALRSTPGGAKPVWTAHGSWSLNLEDPKGSMEAIRGLHAALVQLHSKDKAKQFREEDQHSAVRMLVDPQPSALWRYVQWVVATASAPQIKIYKLAFSSLEPGGWIDNQLPRDNEWSHEPVQLKPDATLLEVKLFRENLDRSVTQQFTILRLSSRPTVLHGIEVPEEVEEGEPGPPDKDLVVELPTSGEPSELHAERWRQVETHLRTLAATGLPAVGEVNTPLPKGIGVPYADVAAVLRLFQRLGCKDVWIEGAPAPLKRAEGGGWAFDK